MTNTLMTSREAFALYCVEQKSKGYWVVTEDDFIAGSEASQAQQAQVIAELRKEINHLGNIANVCTYNALGEICSYCNCKRKGNQ